MGHDPGGTAIATEAVFGGARALRVQYQDQPRANLPSAMTELEIGFRHTVPHGSDIAMLRLYGPSGLLCDLFATGFPGEFALRV